MFVKWLRCVAFKFDCEFDWLVINRIGWITDWSELVLDELLIPEHNWAIVWDDDEELEDDDELEAGNAEFDKLTILLINGCWFDDNVFNMFAVLLAEKLEGIVIILLVFVTGELFLI